MSEAEKTIWREVVASEPPEMFTTRAAQIILADLCRHVATANKLSDLVSRVTVEKLDAEGALEEYALLLKMRDREARAVVEKAVKLRLTNQSRYTPNRAATAGQHCSPYPRPWEPRA